MSNVRINSNDKGRKTLSSVNAKKALNKNEIRTNSTRLLLLQAAEDIFARDGFEKAELGEIAKRAGRTKGSIYAHFKNKEDLFLAIVQQRTRGYTEDAQKRLAHAIGPKEKLRTLREIYNERLRDKRYLLLSLEFKLYAIRNPRSKKKLQQLYRGWYPLDEQRYTDLLGSAPNPTLGLPSRAAALLTIRALLPTLTVEKEFAPDIIDEKMSKELIFLIFNSIVDPGQDEQSIPTEQLAQKVRGISSSSRYGT